MKLPFITRDSHEAILNAVKLEYEKKIADLQKRSTPLLDVLGQEDDKKKPLYNGIEKRAEGVKIAIQMAIGIGLFASLIFKLFIFLFPIHAKHLPIHLSGLLRVAKVISDNDVLALVGYGLAISAGIELIYMLFTPGLDEAVDPLIIGTASGILILLSRSDVSENSMSILVLAIVLAILFTIKRIFFRGDKGEDSKQKDETKKEPART
jgi:hypothetical protein